MNAFSRDLCKLQVVVVSVLQVHLCKASKRDVHSRADCHTAHRLLLHHYYAKSQFYCLAHFVSPRVSVSSSSLADAALTVKPTTTRRTATAQSTRTCRVLLLQCHQCAAAATCVCLVTAAADNCGTLHAACDLGRLQQFLARRAASWP